MTFIETELQGAYLIELEKRYDHRGYFARAWCSAELSDRNLNANVVQINLAYNRLKGTLRGMHFQSPIHREVKLVRCTGGAFYDVIIDLRPDSATYGDHLGLELNAAAGRMLYVPEGCAHGFQTLEDDTTVLYQVSAPYDPEAERGLRFDDPDFGIRWPLPICAISEKDLSWPPFRLDAGLELRARRKLITASSGLRYPEEDG